MFQFWMCEQAAEWSSICRFLNFFFSLHFGPTFYDHFYVLFFLSKCVRDRCENRSARNCVDWAYIQWIIQAITFIFRWTKEKKRTRTKSTTHELLPISNASRQFANLWCENREIKFMQNESIFIVQFNIVVFRWCAKEKKMAAKEWKRITAHELRITSVWSFT